ncbi:MAG TPA: sulfatase-like hydrolase/transferase, partial [Armatimonadota bacterium]|nr:sulfatase-like hydrolase/transferase [Armatimonadota bacterium]
TALIGKAHFQPLRSTPESTSLECQPIMRDLDFWRKFHGPWYGFEHVEVARNHADESHAGQHYGIWMEENGLKNWRDYFWKWPENEPKRKHHWDLPEKYHYSCWTAERTIAYMEQCKAEDKPFFLWSSFQDPHPPYLVPEPWASMYDPNDMVPGKLTPGEHDLNPPHFQKTQEAKPDFSMYRETYGAHGFHSHLISEAALKKNMAIYYGMISLMDQQIGRIMDGLERLGLADNTLVVFSTDHGHFLGQHGLIAKGAFHYEDMIRVPMIAWFPGRIAQNSVNSSLQSLVDYSPTFLAAAGIDVPGLMTGVNQFDVWCGKKDSARDWIVVENRHEPTLVHLRTYVDERYKITVYRDRDYGELFDLEKDPVEVHNRWADPNYAGVKCELLRKFMNATLVCEPTRMPRIAGA